MDYIMGNDLKKGDYIMMKNGWKARIEDNKRGTIRLATVFGWYEEMGSIYIWNVAYRINADGTETPIKLTPAQSKARERVESMGF